MLAGETLELSHVVPTALTDEMVAAIKEATKGKSSVTLQDAVAQGLPDSAVELPTYDRSKLQTGIVHIGLARGDAMGLEAHNLVYMDSLLRADPEANYKWGYTAIGILPGNAELRDVLKKQGYMYTVISKNSKKLNQPDPDMEEHVRVIGSLKEILLAFETPGTMLKVLASEPTRIFSISIGEFGYHDTTSHADSALIELASKGAADAAWDEADTEVSSYLGATGVGIIVAGLAARRASMSGGATIMSSDSVVGNGDMLKTKVLERAAASSEGLKDWIEFNCKFPNTYLDRMSAATNEMTITDLAVNHGVADRFPIVCEIFSEWIIEDKFQEGIRGRPRWEDVGVHIVEDVLEYSAATHRLYTELQFVAAFPALLMGLEHLYEAMHHPVLVKFLHKLLTTYTVPVLLSKPELANFDFERCIDKAIDRLKNTAVASSLQRVIIDASVNFTEQVLPNIVEAEAKGLNGQMMALCVAAWAHYLVRCVENGHAIRDEKARMIEAALTPSPDVKESPAETLGFLLDMEPLFHEMLFQKDWRAMVTKEYERIHTIGMREAMIELLED